MLQKLGEVADSYIPNKPAHFTDLKVAIWQPVETLPLGG